MHLAWLSLGFREALTQETMPSSNLQTCYLCQLQRNLASLPPTSSLQGCNLIGSRIACSLHNLAFLSGLRKSHRLAGICPWGHAWVVEVSAYLNLLEGTGSLPTILTLWHLQQAQKAVFSNCLPEKGFYFQPGSYRPTSSLVRGHCMG